MNIRFMPLYVSDEVIQKMVNWYNDPEILPFNQPNFKSESYPEYTVEDIQHQLIPHPQIDKYLIMDEVLPIGEVSITRDFQLLIKKEPLTAWISICIGDKSYWRKGVAQEAMKFLESTCKRQGYERIELGVFEHNLKAQKLYQKMGYHIFSRIPHFTFYDGTWYDDIRMEKIL